MIHEHDKLKYYMKWLYRGWFERDIQRFYDDCWKYTKMFILGFLGILIICPLKLLWLCILPIIELGIRSFVSLYFKLNSSSHRIQKQ